MSFCKIIKETMGLCADVTYEIKVQSIHGGRADPEVSLVVNDNSINQQEFMPPQPNDNTVDEQSPSDIRQQVAEISRLQCIYHLKTEAAFNEFQRMKEIYRDKDVDVRITRRQGDRSWILMPKQQRWLLNVDAPPSDTEANVTYFDEPASPDYDEFLDDIYIPERIPDRVGFSPYEGDDEQDEENLDEIVLNPCPNPSILKRRRRREEKRGEGEDCVEPVNEEPTEEECNLPKRIRRDSFGFFNFVGTREELYDLNSDDDGQDSQHELLEIAEGLLDSDYKADNEDDLSDAK